jgi:23S rRNA (guanosine2251-2'-O)-methyltransferase
MKAEKEKLPSDIIEGRNPVLEALKSERPIGRIYLAKQGARHGVIAEIIFRAGARAIPVEYLDHQAIDRLSRSTSHQGVLALAAAREYVDLDDILKIPSQKSQAAFLVVLDGVEDPHNLGAILRTAEASGVHGVIVREKRAVGLTEGVEKASAGALEYIPVARVANLTQTLQILKGKNIWVVGIDQSAASRYNEIDYKPGTAIVLGGEGKGLSDLVKKNCDFLAAIPMKGKINSLNASVAAGIVLYEVVNQRDRHTSSS